MSRKATIALISDVQTLEIALFKLAEEFDDA